MIKPDRWYIQLEHKHSRARKAATLLMVAGIFCISFDGRFVFKTLADCIAGYVVCQLAGLKPSLI